MPEVILLIEYAQNLNGKPLPTLLMGFLPFHSKCRVEGKPLPDRGSEIPGPPKAGSLLMS